MRIGVAATPTVAIPTLDWLLESEHDLSLAITRPDKPAGRGRILTDSPVAQWASAHGVECVKPVASEELFESLAFIDLVVTIGYGVILPIEVLSIPRFGFINLHFSLLPAWRGAAPVQRAVLNGDQEIGISVFALDAGMDTGPIYVRQDIFIEPYETAGELLSRLASLGPEAIAKTIAMIESATSATPQSNEGVSYAPKISKEEARIEWNRSVTQVDRQIRAFTPEPGAWTSWRSSTLRVDRARPFLSGHQEKAGTLLIENENVIVVCADGHSLLLEEVTPAGKKSMSAKSWANGARFLDGESLV